MKSTVLLKSLLPRSFLVAIVALPILAGCSNDPVGVAPGDFFGGEGVLLTIRELGADLEWDCAAGRIEDAFETAADGSFDLQGTHTPGPGGPIREDDQPEAETARYTGRLSGSRMTLSVELPERGVTLGPHELRYREEAVLRRCL
jgi:hypothetical protein